MRISFVGVGVMVVAASLVLPIEASRSAQPSPRRAEASNTSTPTAALQDFQKRLQAYLDLRTQLSRKLKPLSPTADSADLATRQETLASAIRQTRKMAKPGDIIPSAVADYIRGVIETEFRRRGADANRALFAEAPVRVRPVINRTMPENTALVTVPPLLLTNLPPLPDNLQYRFLGRHVVLMDGDTRIIVDYILNVLPPR